MNADASSNSPARPVRYAVVFKTYFWDRFVQRQASRCAAAVGSGDFFVSIDETRRPGGNVPFERVVRTNNAEMIALGFADRFEKGSLLWWNADYAHYQFQNAFPGYDLYVFVEYDAVFQGSFDALIDTLAKGRVDLLALPIRDAKEAWSWTKPHEQVYPLEQIQGALLCISIFSSRALELLARRRREMSADTSSPYWPGAEVFVPTEICRAGYVFRSSEEFGDVQLFDWSPATWEGALPVAKRAAFLHPVFDSARFVQWLADHRCTVQDLFNDESSVYDQVSQLPLRHRAWLTARAAAQIVSVQFKQVVDEYSVSSFRT